MRTTIYTYEMPWGETLRISADLSEASAPIRYEGAEEGEWISTPYQTADTRHRKPDMLRLVITHLGPGWYVDPSSARSQREQLEAAVSGAREVR